MHTISIILLWVGGLNWGIIGLGMLMGSEWNVVHMILGSLGPIESIVYLLVGVAAIYELAMHKNTCKNCDKKMMGGAM